MHTWYHIEAAAPLVFRSGKPFEAGSRDGANFPWPSALAGLLRTQVMDARGWKPNDQQAELRKLAVAGPWLGRCDAKGGIEAWLPKPADAVRLLGEDGKAHYRRLAPRPLPAGTGCDLPDGLLPLSFAEKHKGKPQPEPGWWPLARLLDWMHGNDVPCDPLDHAPSPWQVETRTHVAIDRGSFASADGKLFQTEGLDFSPTVQLHNGAHHGWNQDRWLLIGRGPQGIDAGAVTFGGERRLSWLAPHPDPLLAAPAGWAEKLTQGFAVTLATPAVFAGGWRPGWLDDRLEGEVPGIPGLRVRLRAAAVERWQGISGWDLAAWKPRATRKAVAAGATYWFELLQGGEPQLSQLWLAALCDDEQDSRDGFGICLPRPWQTPKTGEA